MRWRGKDFHCAGWGSELPHKLISGSGLGCWLWIIQIFSMFMSWITQWEITLLFKFWRDLAQYVVMWQHWGRGKHFFLIDHDSDMVRVGNKFQPIFEWLNPFWFLRIGIWLLISWFEFFRFNSYWWNAWKKEIYQLWIGNIKTIKTNVDKNISSKRKFYYRRKWIVILLWILWITLNSIKSFGCWIIWNKLSAWGSEEVETKSMELTVANCVV